MYFVNLHVILVLHNGSTIISENVASIMVCVRWKNVAKKKKLSKLHETAADCIMYPPTFAVFNARYSIGNDSKQSRIMRACFLSSAPVESLSIWMPKQCFFEFVVLKRMQKVVYFDMQKYFGSSK